MHSTPARGDERAGLMVAFIGGVATLFGALLQRGAAIWGRQSF